MQPCAAPRTFTTTIHSYAQAQTAFEFFALVESNQEG